MSVARLFRHCSRSFGDYRANRKTVGGLALASAASAGGGLLAAPRLAAQFWTGESASTSVMSRSRSFLVRGPYLNMQAGGIYVLVNLQHVPKEQRTGFPHS